MLCDDDIITDADEDVWLDLHEQGMSLLAIAGNVGWSRETIRTGIASAKKRKYGGQTGRHRKPFGLRVIYGASNKALAVMTCRDIHPCRMCRGEGRTRLVVCPECPGDGCVACEGRGVVTLPDADTCSACGGTGAGEIPKGSRCCCADCHASGLDHRPGYTLTDSERRQIENDRRKAAEDRDRLASASKPGRRRRRRKRQLVA
jgi:hypothetical protein